MQACTTGPRMTFCSTLLNHHGDEMSLERNSYLYQLACDETGCVICSYRCSSKNLSMILNEDLLY